MSTIKGAPGVLVHMGLGQPMSRAFVAGAVVGAVSLVAKYPQAAFRDDGSMKPLSLLSAEPDATNTHFLLVRKSVVITTGMVSTRTKQMSRRDIVEKWRGGKRHVKHLRKKGR